MLFENGLGLRVGFLEAEYQTYFRTGFYFWVMQAYLGYCPHAVTVDMNHNMDISSPEYVTVILDFRWRGHYPKIYVLRAWIWTARSGKLCAL